MMVENCVPNGPASNGGLKVGDYVMEVNGIPVKHHEAAAAMIKGAQGRALRLGVLSMARRPKRLSSSMRVLSQTGDSVRDSRAHKAMEFNKKVGAEQMRSPSHGRLINRSFSHFTHPSGGGSALGGARCEGAAV